MWLCLNLPSRHAIEDWNPVTKEIAINAGNDEDAYAASKKFAELAVWEWAEAHPHVEVTTSKLTFLRNIRDNTES